VSRERPRFQPINFLFGLMMGAADIVPGISGGTVALIVGIYERLIGSVRSAAAIPIHAVRGRIQDARERFLEVDWPLVLPLGLGIVTALVVGARVVEPILEQYPVQFRALFFGLIAASIGIPWARMSERSGTLIAYAAFAAVVAFLIVGVPPREILDPNFIFIFLAASIAICAMILPGVSGSFLLLVMGMYQPTIAALNARDLPYIVVFVLGAAVGLGLFSRLLHHLLRSYHDVTMAALVGLMIGSLRALWPYQDEARTLLGPPSLRSFLIVLGLALVGFLLVFVLARIGARAEARHRADVR
jgi:putative membrane protein